MLSTGHSTWVWMKNMTKSRTMTLQTTQLEKYQEYKTLTWTEHTWELYPNQYIFLTLNHKSALPMTLKQLSQRGLSDSSLSVTALFTLPNEQEFGRAERSLNKHYPAAQPLRLLELDSGGGLMGLRPRGVTRCVFVYVEVIKPCPKTMSIHCWLWTGLQSHIY